MGPHHAAAAGEPKHGDSELRARVESVLPGVVVLREPRVVTFHTMDVMWSEVVRLWDGSSTRVLVADLRETGLPPASIRERLREELRAQRVSHVAVVLGGNRLMQAAARFVVTMILAEQETRVCNTVEAALAWAKQVSGSA